MLWALRQSATSSLLRFCFKSFVLLLTLWADWSGSGILLGLALLAFLDTASWSQWTCFFSIIHSKERQERGFSKFCKWHWWILMRAACSLLRVCSCCHSFSLHWWPCHAAMRARQPKRGKWCLIYINMLFNLMPSICLLESCWQEIHLDRLGHFGYSVACLQACCLTLSWQWIQVELQLTSQAFVP